MLLQNISKLKILQLENIYRNQAVRKIFPPCPITGDFILFARLRPQVSTIAPGEELSISAKMSIYIQQRKMVPLMLLQPVHTNLPLIR